MRRKIVLCPLLCAYAVLFADFSFGQDAQSYLNDIGSTAYGVNIPVENGFINVSNGNLHLEFPIATQPQRGALTLNERLVYDSRIWAFASFGTHGSYHWWPSNIWGVSQTAGGWRFVTGAETGSMVYSPISSVTSPCSYGGDSTQTDTLSALSWTDPNGTLHPSNAKADITSGCENYGYISPGTTTDGSGYSINDDGSGNPIVVDAQGTQVYPQIADRYGNYWSTDANGILTDDTGRVPVIVTQSGNTTYYDVLSPNGTINNNGTRVRYTVTTALIPVATNFNQSDTYEWLAPYEGGPELMNPVQSIGLPNGSQYAFTYDTSAEIASITLPSGGVIHYGYTNFVDSANTENRWLLSRSVGTNPYTTFSPSVVTTCQNYSTGCIEHVNVRKPSGDEQVYELTLNNGAWNTATQIYSGATTANQILMSVTNIGTYTNGCTDTTQCIGANYLSSSILTTALFPTPTQLPIFTQTQSFYNPSNGQLNDLKEWDYVQAQSASIPSPSGTPSRETKYVYTANGRDLQSVTILDSHGIQAGQTTYGYTSDASPTSGITQHGTQNAGGPYLQSVSHWLNTGGSSTSTYSMDDTGQLVSTVDANQNYPSRLTYQCANSLPSQSTNSLGQSTAFGYDCNSGALISVRDPNDLASGRSGTTYSYESAAGRVQSINYPDGGQTSFSYPSATEVDTTILATPSPSVSSKDIADTFGRTAQHIRSGISSETTYDTSGRVSCVSNPHFISGTSATDGNTCITSYDGLDRPLIELEQDQSTRTWSYAGNIVTSTDESGNAWRRASNAFGHLNSVIEPGGAATGYQYDGLGNLATITQSGIIGETPRIRHFVYDSLSRLVSSTNPESGTTSYGYDLDGNVTSKTDARGITTSYVYDPMNRIWSKTSTGGNGVPGFDHEYAYDSPDVGQNEIGRLSTAYIANATEIYSYDAMGRTITQSNWLPSTGEGGELQTIATYDLAGNMTSLTYPDGRSIHQSWDGSGNLSLVADGAGYNYLSSASYWPDGSPSAMSYGNGLSSVYSRNNRSQTNVIGAGRVGSQIAAGGYPGSYSGSNTFSTKQYCYGPATSAISSTIPGCPSLASGNSGNIWQVMDTVVPGSTDTFTYDNLNRVTSLLQVDGTKRQIYAYDSFGNLNQTGTNSDLQTNLTFNANNRVNSGYVYDAAGNATSVYQGTYAFPYVYDAENHLVNFNNGEATYTYDALENRVRKDIPNEGIWTEYVRFNGQVLAEKNSIGFWSDYIFANGRRIARSDNYDIRIHLSGTNCPAGNCTTPSYASATVSAPSDIIQPGDLLTWRQYQDGSAIGGINMSFSNGVSASSYLSDSDGQPIEADTVTNSWHQRVVDLSPFGGNGLTIASMQPWMSPTSGTGNWDIYFGDIVLVHANGTSTTIYSRSSSSPSIGYFTSSVSNFSAVSEQVATTPVPYATTFYSGDQIGSTTLLTDSGGWPVSSYNYYPFGPEFENYDNNNYRFIGEEEDNESGLDYFHARHYSPLPGRFMSPDPYSGSFDLANPQSFNRYSYVNNNPLTFTDPSGLDGGSSAAGCFAVATGTAGPLGDVICGITLLLDGLFIDSLFSHPKFTASTVPRPSGTIWDEHGSYQAKPYSSAADILGLSGSGCEFGVCGAGPSSLTPGQRVALGGPIIVTPPQWLVSFVAQFTTATGNALHAPPLKVNSGVCSIYGDQPYLGAGLQCVCQSAGDGPWSQDTRGSLAADQMAGINEYIAHGTSYAGSTVRTQSFPAITLGTSYMSCKRW